MPPFYSPKNVWINPTTSAWTNTPTANSWVTIPVHVTISTASTASTIIWYEDIQATAPTIQQLLWTRPVAMGWWGSARGRERQAREAEPINAPAVLRPREEAAARRANELLLEHLTPEQRRSFEANEWFIVEGGKSKTKYRIRKRRDLIANVDVMINGAVHHRLCAHCDHGAVPLGDHLLAQKIMLELAEDDFLRIANRHGA